MSFSNGLLDGVSKTWVVTGGAGFIGSHLCEYLLQNGQYVRAVDNFSTGSRENVQFLKGIGGSNFEFREGDVSDLNFCKSIVGGVQFVSHQAALGSVPRSIDNPVDTHRSNIDGHFNLLSAAQNAGIKRFIFASSSSVYGDNQDLPKKESNIGSLQSPYAVTKYVNELYGEVFNKTYGMETIGLRYFNVFGPRQRVEGAYVAVIPIWINALLNDQPVTIFGDGNTSRDFTFVKNVVQANVLAATTQNSKCFGRVFNVAVGKQTSLLELYQHIKNILGTYRASSPRSVPNFEPKRKGDIAHTRADISAFSELVGYAPEFDITAGLEHSVKWFVNKGVRPTINEAKI